MNSFGLRVFQVKETHTVSFCRLPTLLSCALELGSSYSGDVKRCSSGFHMGARGKWRLPKKAEP